MIARDTDPAKAPPELPTQDLAEAEAKPQGFASTGEVPTVSSVSSSSFAPSASTLAFAPPASSSSSSSSSSLAAHELTHVTQQK